MAAYFRYVERHIYSHPKARKMLSLDGDPVRAWTAASAVIGIPHSPYNGWCASLRRRCSLRCSCKR